MINGTLDQTGGRPDEFRKFPKLFRTVAREIRVVVPRCHIFFLFTAGDPRIYIGEFVCGESRVRSRSVAYSSEQKRLREHSKKLSYVFPKVIFQSLVSEKF